jgi:hypothetical protein
MSLSIQQDATYAGDDSWRWSVWIDGPDDELDQIDRVAWHLHPTFSPPIRFVEDRGTGFRLDAMGWGTFEVGAVLYHAGSDASFTRLTHELDLYYPDEIARDRRPRVYISSSRRDARIVARLTETLDERGIDVLGDQDLSPGTEWSAGTAAQINDADAVVAIVDQKIGPWVEDEVRQAAAARTLLIPVVFGTSDLPSAMEGHNSIRASDASDLDSIADRIASALGQ